MAKPKTPLLSLEAHGTLADTLTYQGRGERKIARQKPRLPYFLTLPSQYQRWLYQDYAYLWRQQSAATQKAYRARGVRFHLTGFQYWMKYNLTHLPDIVAMWPLDTVTGGTTPDTSRNAHNATVIGATPSNLAINGALSFDGINDYVAAPAAFLHPTTYITVEFFLRFNGAQTPVDLIFMQATAAPVNGTYLQLAGDARTLMFWCYLNGVGRRAQSLALDMDTLYHVACVYDRVSVKLYINATLQAFSQAKVDDIGQGTSLFYIARHTAPANYIKADIDNFIVYNRALTQTEITRHSARRWPPQ